MIDFKPSVVFSIGLGVVILYSAFVVFETMQANDMQNSLNEQTLIEKQSVASRNLESEEYIDNDAIDINLNPVSDYDNLTKEEIYQLRRDYVADSLFASSDYSPSDEVFGQIKSEMPWYGLDYSGCIGVVKGNEKVIQGPSEESRFVNNPNMLVGVISGSKIVNVDDPVCFEKKYWLLPDRFTYSPKNKKIEVVYNFRYTGPMQLVGLNARDLGYKYVYAANTQNINFDYLNNVSDSVYKFRDFIHMGSSCGYNLNNGGCNNASPYQNELAYKFADYPAVLDLKLWKNKPLSVDSVPDMSYKIIFK